MLSDEDIWAALAYIKSSWPPDIREAQRELTLKQSRRWVGGAYTVIRFEAVR